MLDAARGRRTAGGGSQNNFKRLGEKLQFCKNSPRPWRAVERAGRGRGHSQQHVQNCSLAKLHTDLGEHWNEQVSNDLANNCNLAKICQDLGEHWNEQVSLDTNNCNLAKICNDLGDQWNEQVSLDMNNCNLAKIYNDLGDQRYPMT
jgi:hypothetical protein